MTCEAPVVEPSGIVSFGGSPPRMKAEEPLLSSNGDGDGDLLKPCSAHPHSAALSDEGARVSTY